MAIGVPGWPEFACWTASIDNVRMVLIDSWSRSGVVIQGLQGEIVARPRRRAGATLFRLVDFGNLTNAALFAASEAHRSGRGVGAPSGPFVSTGVVSLLGAPAARSMMVCRRSMTSTPTS